MARNKNKSGSLWDEVTTVPEEELVKKLKNKKQSRYKWMKRGVWLSIIMTPILAIVALMWYMDSQNPDPVPQPPTSLEINDSIGKNAAITTVETWLASEPQPIPGATLISWNGYETQKKPAIVDEESRETAAGVIIPTWGREVHYFSVSSANGMLFQVTLEVDVDPVLGARVEAIPFAEPLVPTVSGGWEDAGEPWFGYQSAQTTPGITASVEAWVQAYMGGNPATLRNIVGDPNENHFYLPMSGIQKVTVNVERVAYKPSDDPNAPAVKNPDTVLARIKVELLWKGQVQENAESYATMTLDLLIEDADTASPRVVAWGGPGSGAALERYGNAIVGVTIDTVPDPTREEGQIAVEEEGPEVVVETPAPGDGTTDGTTDGDGN